MNWAIRIDMYTLMCIKLMTNKNLLYKKKKNRVLKHMDMVRKVTVRESTVECSRNQESNM